MKEIKIVFPSRARACKRLYLVNACDRKGKCSNIYKHLVQHRHNYFVRQDWLQTILLLPWKDNDV